MATSDERSSSNGAGTGHRRAGGGWALAAGGGLLLVVAFAADPRAARAATAQVWSPFVLVGGLILIGLVADEDGLFATLGHRLAMLAPNGFALFAGSAVVVAVVTALLNLDTSVVFLTPVLVYAARSRGSGSAPLLIVCILVSNAGSLLLPGSNLTNLIVLGHLHLSGGAFASRMALPWMGSALDHLGTAGTAGFAASATVLLNNLPAAALLAARTPPHPFALLIGLDVGPNLFVTGSLAWVLWWRTTRATGTRPPVTRAILLRLVTTPLAMAVALLLLGTTGTS